MFLWSYVWRPSSFHYRNISLNGVMGFPVIDIISVWSYHWLLSARLAGFFLYVTIHSSPPCEGASVEHRKRRKSFIRIPCSAMWMYPHYLLKSTPGLFSFPYPFSIYPSLHLHNTLLSLIIYSAGFTTSLCLNTPALQHPQQGSCQGSPAELLNAWNFSSFFVKLWQCGGENRCWFRPALMCGMNDYDRSAAFHIQSAFAVSPEVSPFG